VAAGRPSTDAHDAAHLANLRYGVWVARRGWLEAKDVLNTLPVEELRKRLARRSPKRRSPLYGEKSADGRGARGGLDMLTWDRILCAVDFTEPSRFAMEAAADLACRYGSQLTLVHVHETPAAAKPEVLLAPPELFETSVREREQKLEQWSTEAERLAARPINTLLLNGPAALEIVRAAQDDRSDLVVIATRGRTGLRRVVLGSVAEHVVRTAPCPVLVVRSARAPESK
jgi:nucleotide-binding universal stress UspA family protein